MTIVASELARRMADSLILPFNINTYASELKKEMEYFLEDNESLLNELNINLDYLIKSINDFALEADSFHKRLSQADKTKYENS